MELSKNSFKIIFVCSLSFFTGIWVIAIIFLSNKLFGTDLNYLLLISVCGVLGIYLTWMFEIIYQKRYYKLKPKGI
jgi:hypothetical protein